MAGDNNFIRLVRRMLSAINSSVPWLNGIENAVLAIILQNDKTN